MNKFLPAIIVSSLIIVGSDAAIAAQLTVPNKFVAGSKAIANDVNADFDAVTAAVNDNDSRITSNSTDVTTLTTKVNNNATAIDVNTTAIGTTQSGLIKAVNDNTSNIAADLLLINANTTAIGAKADASTITTLDSAVQQLQQNGNKTGTACAGNDINDVMVRVGPLCVDKYEASVWGTSSGGAPATELDGVTNVIPCNVNGNDCSVGGANPIPIYARSQAGVLPSTNITWFQALQACANAGKRLLTNAEWQMAAAGTPDPGVGGTGPTANCNVGSTGKVNTGLSTGAQACVSNWGVYDMIGNVNEWVADWMQGAGAPSSSPNNSASYGNDLVAAVQLASQQANGSQFPAAVYRGGGFIGDDANGVFTFNAAVAPSYSGAAIGFRCGR